MGVKLHTDLEKREEDCQDYQGRNSQSQVRPLIVIKLQGAQSSCVDQLYSIESSLPFISFVLCIISSADVNPLLNTDVHAARPRSTPRSLAINTPPALTLLDISR